MIELAWLFESWIALSAFRTTGAWLLSFKSGTTTLTMSYHSHTSLNKFITWKTKRRLLSTQNLLWIKTFKTITPDHILRAFAPSHLILSRRLKLLCKRSCDWLFRSSYDKRIISIGCWSVTMLLW